ncbi:uncharacterized protein ACIGJ3_015352 [Trichechus inunguis]
MRPYREPPLGGTAATAAVGRGGAGRHGWPSRAAVQPIKGAAPHGAFSLDDAGGGSLALRGAGLAVGVAASTGSPAAGSPPRPCGAQAPHEPPATECASGGRVVEDPPLDPASSRDFSAARPPRGPLAALPGWWAPGRSHARALETRLPPSLSARRERMQQTLSCVRCPSVDAHGGVYKTWVSVFLAGVCRLETTQLDRVLGPWGGR